MTAGSTWRSSRSTRTRSSGDTPGARKSENSVESLTLLTTLLDFSVEKGLIKPGVHIPLNQTRFERLIVNSGWEKAEAAYREDRKLNPESDLMDMSALENTAGSLAKDKKMKEAIEVVTLMAKEYPTSAQAYDDLGDVYKMNSQPQQAIEASQKALSLIDNDAKLSADDKKQVKDNAEKRIAELSKK